MGRMRLLQPLMFLFVENEMEPTQMERLCW